MKLSMTTRRWLVVISLIALGMWIAMAYSRTFPLRRHLLPSNGIPGVFDYEAGYCPYLPFWPKFVRILLGQPWPGNFRCPYHPKSDYAEPPSNDPNRWWWQPREAS